MASIATPQIVVALGAVEAGLVEPVLAPHQRMIHKPAGVDFARADAAIVRAAYTVDRELLDRMPALKVIARTGVGTDLVDVAEANRRGIPGVVTPGSNTASVAEGVIAHLLALVKQLSTLTSLVREGGEERFAVNVGDLEGFTLGIIGYGRIGRRVARIAEPSTSMSWPSIRSPTSRPASAVKRSRSYCAGAIRDPGRAADGENHNLINAERIALMTAGAVGVDCSRGGLVDLDAAHGALLSGQLAGLGLDVYDPEPPAHHPVFDHGNVVLTPHLMGFTRQGMVHTVRDAAKGAVDVLAGRTPPAVAAP